MIELIVLNHICSHHLHTLHLFFVPILFGPRAAIAVAALAAAPPATAHDNSSYREHKYKEQKDIPASPITVFVILLIVKVEGPRALVGQGVGFSTCQLEEGKSVEAKHVFLNLRLLLVDLNTLGQSNQNSQDYKNHVAI